MADGDQDGVVDLDDFLDFIDCVGAITPGCEMMDLNGQSVIDAVDFELFLTRYSGPDDDCNDNQVHDLSDIFYGTSSDVDHDGIPDGCPPPTTPGGRVGVAAAPLTIDRLPGGDLQLQWSASTDHVLMTGPAVEVFTGRWPAACGI